MSFIVKNVDFLYQNNFIQPPYKAKEYIYDVIFSEFHILTFFLKLIGLLLNFKTASLLSPSLTPENFNSIGSVVTEISYAKISENKKSFIFDSSSANSLNSTHCALCETIGHNNHLVLSESNKIYI